MKGFIEIMDRKIGYDYDPLVIAEIGINHNGSLITALEMVDAAYRSGCEIVKHQTHIVEDEMTSLAKKIIPQNANVSIYEIMKQCSLDEEEEIELKNYVEAKGMIFISTPFSRAAANRLHKMNVPAYKIGSGECNNYPLIEHISSFGKPIILSTGMNSLESIKKAVKILKKNNVPYALLHTTNLYPTPNQLVRLGAINELNKAFPNVVVGLSDHTLSNHACFGAVALGASILERHFTDHKKRIGPDIICSMDEKECKELIDGTKILKQQRGGSKNPVKEEQVTIDFAFATVCTIRQIKKNEMFTKENLWVKRPGIGEISAEQLNQIIGKFAVRDLENDIQVKWSDIVL